MWHIMCHVAVKFCDKLYVNVPFTFRDDAWCTVTLTLCDKGPLCDAKLNNANFCAVYIVLCYVV